MKNCCAETATITNEDQVTEKSSDCCSSLKTEDGSATCNCTCSCSDSKNKDTSENCCSASSCC